MPFIKLLAQILDILTDIGLKVVGLYFFFIKRDFISGAILLGASGMYSLSIAAAYFINKDRKK